MPTPTAIHGPPHALGDLLATVRLRVRALAWQTVAWVRARTPEQLLWVALGLVIFAYLVVLWTASTATGRGGR